MLHPWSNLQSSNYSGRSREGDWDGRIVNECAGVKSPIYLEKKIHPHLAESASVI